MHAPEALVKRQGGLEEMELRFKIYSSGRPLLVHLDLI